MQKVEFHEFNKNGGSNKPKKENFNTMFTTLMK